MEGPAEDLALGARCVFALPWKNDRVNDPSYPVFYFRQSYLISDVKMVEMVEVSITFLHK